MAHRNPFLNRKKKKKKEEPKKTTKKATHSSRGEERREGAQRARETTTVKVVSGGVQYGAQRRARDVVQATRWASKQAYERKGIGNRGKSGAIHKTRSDERANEKQKTRSGAITSQHKKEQQQRKDVRNSNYQQVVTDVTGKKKEQSYTQGFSTAKIKLESKMEKSLDYATSNFDDKKKHKILGQEYSNKDIAKGGIKLADEMVDYLIPYGATTKTSLKIAEGALKASKGAKAGKALTEATEKGLKGLSKDGKKKVIKEYTERIAKGEKPQEVLDSIQKQVMKSDLKQNVKRELLANAMQDATIGTTIDAIKGKQRGLKGKEFRNYMLENAAMNAAIGLPVSRLAGRTGKAGKQELAQQIAKTVNEKGLAQSEGKELLNLMARKNKLGLNEAQEARLGVLQRKAEESATGVAKTNGKGKLVADSGESLDTVLNASERNELMKLKAQQSMKGFSLTQKTRLAELENKVVRANVDKAIKISDNVLTAKKYVGKATGKDVGNLKEAKEYYSRMRMTDEAKQVDELLQKATKNYQKSLDNVIAATKSISEAIGRNVTVESADDFARALSEARGVSFDGKSFTDDPDFDISEVGGFAVHDADGNIAEIHINKDSSHAMEYTLGHELTHAFESLGDDYQQLGKLVKEIAGDDWERELAYVERQYANVDDADVEKEAVANLIGKYMFDEESDFFRSLAKKDPTIFEKIRDFVKKLFSGMNEKSRDLETLNKSLDDLYEELKNNKELGDVTGAKLLFGGEESVEKVGHVKQKERLNKAKNALEKAKTKYGDNKEMLNKEKGRIFARYHWFQGIDGKWRYEIPDDRMKFNHKIEFSKLDESPSALVGVDNAGNVTVNTKALNAYKSEAAKLDQLLSNKNLTKAKRSEYEKAKAYVEKQMTSYQLLSKDGMNIGEFLNHKQFFEMFPEAVTGNPPLTVRLKTGLKSNDFGAYDFGKNQIELNADLFNPESKMYKDLVGGQPGQVDRLARDPKKEAYRTIAHELQHYIQQQDNLAKGGDMPDTQDIIDHVIPRNYERDGARLKKINEKKEDAEYKLYKIDDAEADEFFQKYSGYVDESDGYHRGYKEKYNSQLEKFYKNNDKTGYIKLIYSMMKKDGLNIGKYANGKSDAYRTALQEYLARDFDAGKLSIRKPEDRAKVYNEYAGEIEARSVEDRLFEEGETEEYGDRITDNTGNYPVKEGENARWSEVGISGKDKYGRSIDELYPDRLTKNEKGTVELLFGGERSIANLKSTNPKLADALQKNKDIAVKMLSDAKSMFDVNGVKTFDEYMELTRKRSNAGLERYDIHKKTGWFQGVDGKWRYEINDNNASLIKGLKKIMEEQSEREKNGDVLRLSEILNHKDLFDAYPDMKDVEVRVFSDPNVSWTGVSSGNHVEFNLAKFHSTGKDRNVELKKVLLHELQHEIQGREGFARGNNYDAMNKLDIMDRLPMADQEKYFEYCKEAKDSLRKLRDAIEDEVDNGNSYLNEYMRNLRTNEDDTYAKKVAEALPNCKDENDLKRELDKLQPWLEDRFPKDIADAYHDFMFDVTRVEFEPKIQNAWIAYSNSIGEQEAREVSGRMDSPKYWYYNKKGEYKVREGESVNIPDAIIDANELEARGVAKRLGTEDYSKNDDYLFSEDLAYPPLSTPKAKRVSVIDPETVDKFPDRLTKVSYMKGERRGAKETADDFDDFDVNGNRKKPEATASQEEVLRPAQMKDVIERSKRTASKEEMNATAMRDYDRAIEEFGGDEEFVKIFDDRSGSGAFGKIKAATKEEADLRAANELKQLGYEELRKQYLQSDITEDPNLTMARNVALQNEINRMIKSGEGDKAQLYADKAEVMEKISSYTGLSSKMMNAVKRYLTSTPEGRVRAVRNEIKRLEKLYKERIKGGKLQIDDAKLEKLATLKKQYEIDELLDEINKDLWEQIPATLFERINEYRHCFMLFNAKTHGRNVVGNSIFRFCRKLSDEMEAGMLNSKWATNKLADIQKMKPNEVVVDRVHVSKKDEIKPNKMYLYNEFRSVYDKSGSRNKFIELGRPDGVDTVRWKAMQKLIDFNYGWLEREDLKGALIPAFNKAYVSWCKARCVKEVGAKDYSPEALQKFMHNMSEADKKKARHYALAEGEYATFRDACAFSDWLTGKKQTFAGKKGKNSWGTFGYRVLDTALEGAIPFVKTPVNIFRRSVDFSPASFVPAALNIAKAENADMFKQGIHQLCTGLTGTGIMGMGVYFASQGIVMIKAGEESGDAYYDRDMGYQDYSVKLNLGGKEVSMTLDWAQPMQASFFMGAAFHNALANMYDEETGKWHWDDQSIINAFFAITSPMTDTSFMSSPKDTVQRFLENATRSETGETNFPSAMVQLLAGDIPKNYVSGLAPQLLAQLAGTMDDYQRDTRGVSENSFVRGWESAGRQLINKVPVLREHVLNPKLNRKGNEVANDENMAVRIAKSFFMPMNVKEITKDKYDEELIKIRNGIEDKSSKDYRYFFYNLTGNPPYGLANGKRMTYREAYDYGKTSRTQQNQMIKSMVDADSYGVMTQKMKQDEVGEAYWIAKAKADMDTYSPTYAIKALASGEHNKKEIESIKEYRRLMKGTLKKSEIDKKYMDYYIEKEKLVLRAHASGDDVYKLKALVTLEQGKKVLRDALDIKANHVKDMQKYWGLVKADGGNLKQSKATAFKELTDGCCSIMSHVDRAGIDNPSKGVKSVSAGIEADAKRKISERVYRAYGHNWNSAQSGAGLMMKYNKDGKYSVEKIQEMKAKIRLQYDANNSGGVNKDEVVQFIKDQKCKTADEAACLFEVLYSQGNYKNPFKSQIDDHLEWGENHDDEWDTGKGSGGGWGRGWGRGGHGHGGGGGGGSKPARHPVANVDTASGIFNGKVTNPAPLSNFNKKSNLDEAYRKKARKLREANLLKLS